MTDGTDSRGGSAASRSGLDRVARELRELQDDLARLGEHSRTVEPDPSSPATTTQTRERPAPSPFQAPEPADGGDVTPVDEAPARVEAAAPDREPAGAAAAPESARGESRRPLPPPVSEVPHASQQLAKAIVDDAFAQAERILSDAQARTDELAGQIEHLIATRDRMQQAADRLVGEFERAISELRRPPRPPSTGV